MSLAWNYGPGACELMLDEVGKYPEFYKLGLHNVDSPEDLSGEAKGAWDAIMHIMVSKYPEVKSNAVWKAWRWIRRYYSTSKCPQKYAGRIHYLTKMKLDKIEESAYQKEAWKTSAIVFNKVSTAELRKSIPSLAVKNEPSPGGVKTEPSPGVKTEPSPDASRSGLRPKDRNAIATCGIRKNMTFDNTYSPKPNRSHRPKKAAGILGRGRMSVIDSFAVQYGEEACNLLFDEIGKYPDIYTPSCNIPDPHGLHEGARSSWAKIVKRMHEVYPSMNHMDAWKAWRTLRRNYNNTSCPKNWVGKLPFLNELLANKDQFYTRTRPQKEEQVYEEQESQQWSETEETGKFANILDRLQNDTYDENALLDDPSFLEDSMENDESMDDYEEDQPNGTPMQMLLSNVQRASEQSPSTSVPQKRRIIHLPVVSKKARMVEYAAAAPAPPPKPVDDSFRTLVKEKWNEIAELPESKANLSILKKRIMRVLNNAYTEAGM